MSRTIRSPTRVPTLRGSLSNIPATMKPRVRSPSYWAIARTEVARSDDREPLDVVRAEDALDAVDEQSDVVAHPALAELPEVRQVAPDLRGIHLGELGELGRGYRLRALLPQVHEDVEVRTEAAR